MAASSSSVVVVRRASWYVIEQYGVPTYFLYGGVWFGATPSQTTTKMDRENKFEIFRSEITGGGAIYPSEFGDDDETATRRFAGGKS